MLKLKTILKCYALGMGIKGISSTFELSRNTVRKYVRKFLDSGISMETLLSMDENRLQEIFMAGHPRHREPSENVKQLEALLPEYANRLKRKGVTIASLYEEYHKAYPEGLKHSSFGVYLQRYRLAQKVVGHVEHYAGEQMYVDFAGDRLKIYDGVTAEPRSVEVFVAILPCSHYTYCEAVWSQKKEDLIRACENALHYFGGSPQAIVPDNLKSAVTKSDRHEPVINEDFSLFAEHYGCVVYPARVRHPKDKALVENAVRLMYRYVYTELEGILFESLEDLNSAIRIALDKFNAMKMSGRNQSRRQMFEKVEYDYLQPLPQSRYLMKERRSVTVMRNSYVSLLGHHYSMPKEYVGKRVEIVYDSDTVEIFYGLRLVTVHSRDDTSGGYTTKEAHNLPGRHGGYDRDIDGLYKRAAEIDNIVVLYLQQVAAEIKYPPKIYRSCRGILGLEAKYGSQRLIAGCMCATNKHTFSYREVSSILQNGEEKPYMPVDTDEGEADDQHMPISHDNIRGPAYFAASDKENKNNDNPQSKNNGNKR